MKASLVVAAALLSSGAVHSQAGGAIGGLLGGGVGRVIGKGVAGGSLTDEHLQNAAEHANRDLPKMVDDVTRLDRVAAEPGKRMVFFNTLTSYRTPEVDLARFYSEFAPRIRSSACGNVDTRRMLDGGVTMEWTYKGSDRGHIGSVRATIKDCPAR
jgi:hypothetical protein